ncbi:hypothetical protein CLOSTHATH_02548 [Hungatella hathewayi DSM 13479]|jgi:hypothetical protein|uniref:Uncharacterized protein n=1 Tax=Hungatella hathewayi DSM 13479 TaxID=566550 RepID=D3AG12_9FIRM|nr:hypothetical protein CLOSTHATH_02548 [Hungatella hathewayi DSM 13479]
MTAGERNLILAPAGTKVNLRSNRKIRVKKWKTGIDLFVKSDNINI